MHFETECEMAKLSKAIDFGTNRKRVCDFLLVINSNLGPTYPVLQIMHVFGREQRPYPYSTVIWGLFPWTIILPTLWLRGAKTLS